MPAHWLWHVVSHELLLVAGVASSMQRPSASCSHTVSSLCAARSCAASAQLVGTPTGHSAVLQRHSRSRVEPGCAARLLMEARAMARLNHPHIVAVYDAGEDNGISYIVMELVRGKTLSQLEGGELAYKQALGYIYEVLDASRERPKYEALLSGFDGAMAAYRIQNWREAAARFGELLAAYPDDGPTRVFLQRALEYLENAPESDWDGVYVMKSK